MENNANNVELWHGVLSRELGWHATSIESIRANVFRLRLSAGNSAPESVIIKLAPHSHSHSVWTEDKPDHAESLLHKALLNGGASLPALYWAGSVVDTPYWAEICEDLTSNYEIRDYQCCWSMDELLAVAEAVAEFHAAGLRLDLSGAEYEWLAERSRLRLINSEWLRSACSRLAEHPSALQNASASGLLLELADKYDSWMSILASWQTVLHGDVFWANVGLQWLDKHQRWQAKLIDLDCALTGLPHYDVVYMMQRGWNTDADWEAVQRKHSDVFRRAVSLDISDGLWSWAYKLTNLQLVLNWHYSAICIMDKGEEASESEMEWVKRGGTLWGPGFIETCEAALRQAPSALGGQ